MKHGYLFLVALLFVSTGYGQENILLEEYMPKSIYKIPETKVEKAKYPVIDAHSHDYPSSTGHRTKCIWVEIEKKEKRFVGQRVVYDDGIKAYKTKCLRGFN